MLKNYLKTALRNIKRQKGFSFINIFGLALGMTCFILILMFVQYEHSYDRYHENAGDIYRIVTMISNTSSPEENDIMNETPFPLKEAVKEDFGEVKYSTHVYQNGGTLKFNDRIFQEDKIFLVDPDFFKIFSFPVIS